MTRLGVFITTHISPEATHRHGPEIMSRSLDYFREYVLEGYVKYSPGEEVDVHICDTGSTHPDFRSTIDHYLNYDQENAWAPQFFYHQIPNHGGCFAALKWAMHTAPQPNAYDYCLFHVDDGVEPTADGWARDLIEQYEAGDNIGLMCRQVDKELLGPAGLVNHRNIAPHVAQMYGINHIKSVSHTHADWWMFDRQSLTDMARVWWEPINCEVSMDFQKKYEEMDFKELCELDSSRRLVDNIHIGRETDGALRVETLLHKNVLGYTGNKFKAVQMHHRINELQLD